MSEGAIFLPNQSVTADDPAAAIDLSAIPSLESVKRSLKLSVTIDNSGGSVDVSLTAPAAEAHSPYRIPVGAIGQISLAWPQPAGSPFETGISVFAASSQAVAVGLEYA